MSLPLTSQFSSLNVADVRVTSLERKEVDLSWAVFVNGSRPPEDVNRVQVKAATQAQAARERDLDTLPIEVLYAVEERMPERWRLGVLLGGVLGLRSGEARALQRQRLQSQR